MATQSLFDFQDVMTRLALSEEHQQHQSLLKICYQNYHQWVIEPILTVFEFDLSLSLLEPTDQIYRRLDRVFFTHLLHLMRLALTKNRLNKMATVPYMRHIATVVRNDIIQANILPSRYCDVLKLSA